MKPCKICGFRPAVGEYRLVSEYDPIFRVSFMNFRLITSYCADCQKERR